MPSDYYFDHMTDLDPYDLLDEVLKDPRPGSDVTFLKGLADEMHRRGIPRTRSQYVSRGNEDKHGR